MWPNSNQLSGERQLSDFNKFSFFEKLYFHELDRKQKLETGVSLPTGAIVAAFGVVGYFFTHFRFQGQPYFMSFLGEYVFLCSTALAAFLLTLATYWCFKAAVGSSYEFLPDSERLQMYSVELEDWHRANSGTGWAELAQIEFQNYLITAMAKCGRMNFEENKVRSEELHRTKRATVSALTALAFAAASYYVDFWYDPPMFRS
jgi:hypothetical protein